jgi:hypothetical protein
MTSSRNSKPTIEDVLDEVAARQRALGIVVDEQETADAADRAVAAVREEDRKRRSANQ